MAPKASKRWEKRSLADIEGEIDSRNDIDSRNVVNNNLEPANALNNAPGMCVC